MKIMTRQISRRELWRLQGDIDGQLAVDTTVKSSKGKYKLLAPSWDIVMGHKNGRISDEQYTAAYKRILADRNHSGEVTALIEDMLKHEEVYLYCYCQPGKFCHRHLIAKWMKAKADQLGIPCEIEPETP